MTVQDSTPPAPGPRCAVFFELLADGVIDAVILEAGLEPSDLIRGLRDVADDVWAKEQAKATAGAQ